MAALLVFIIATLVIVFGRKKLLDAEGPFGDNVFKNPARYIHGFITNQLNGLLPVGTDVSLVGRALRPVSQRAN